VGCVSVVRGPTRVAAHGVHRWVDHTAELELEIEAASEQGVFEEALAALGGLLAERTGGEEETDAKPVRHEVSASAPDRATLLAEWLSELAYLAESEGFVPTRAVRLELLGNALDATVVGRRASPPHLVKGVTYHRLGIWEEDETWRARVIFDV
jgi:SHS2 domain-containing protein